MPNLGLIIFFTILVSLISFVGILVLLLKDLLLHKILLFLVALSAGALLGDAFFHLIPETISGAGLGEEFVMEVFLYLMLGFCVFFVLENFIKWHHHHDTRHPEIKSFSYMIIFSDGLHNFIDGLIIAGSFLAGTQAGIATTLAIILHEIPQEIGDFAVLIYGGFKKAKALLFNFLSGLLGVLGGLAGYFLFRETEKGILFLLAFTAGSFIYISASDLIPQIKEETSIKKSAAYFLTFLSGIAIMFLMKLLFK